MSWSQGKEGEEREGCEVGKEKGGSSRLSWHIKASDSTEALRYRDKEKEMFRE